MEEKVEDQDGMEQAEHDLLADYGERAARFGFRAWINPRRLHT